MELAKYIYLFLRKITKLTNLFSPELQKIKSESVLECDYREIPTEAQKSETRRQATSLPVSLCAPAAQGPRSPEANSSKNHQEPLCPVKVMFITHIGHALHSSGYSFRDY